MSTSKRQPARKAQEVPQGTRGTRSDLAKYELFAEWAMKEHGFKVLPEQAQFAILQYKHFQSSDLNRKFNAAKSAALAKGREQAAKSASARKATPTTTKKVAASPKPAPKATAKKTTARRTRKAA